MTKEGLLELWSPGTIEIFLSPAYASCNFFVCYGNINVSSSPAIKNAGINALLTWFFKGSISSKSKFALD